MAYVYNHDRCETKSCFAFLSFCEKEAHLRDEIVHKQFFINTFGSEIIHAGLMLDAKLRNYLTWCKYEDSLLWQQSAEEALRECPMFATVIPSFPRHFFCLRNMGVCIFSRLILVARIPEHELEPYEIPPEYWAYNRILADNVNSALLEFYKEVFEKCRIR